MSYEVLTGLKDLNVSSKRVIVLGTGWMAEQYALALKALRVSDVTLVGRNEDKARQIAAKFGYAGCGGGYEAAFKNGVPSDLLIVATPIKSLLAAADTALECGHRNVLVEKPGALTSREIADWEKRPQVRDSRVRVAYNRLTYPSVWKLRGAVDAAGGATSCVYTFTEWVHTINFEKDPAEVYTRWGISNTLHLLSLAHGIVGMPAELDARRTGSLPWHPSGAVFVGSGISTKGVPFSYNANWLSAGRWGVDVQCATGTYRLMPLEKLAFCPKGSVNFEDVKLEPAFPDVKVGLAELVAVMLEPSLERSVPLTTVAEAAAFNTLAERVFGY